MSRKFVFPGVLIFTFCVSVFMLSNIALAAEDLNEFLVAYWPFDEDGGNEVIDATENGSDGIVNGADWTEGQFEGALEFDGVASNVMIPDTDALDVSEELTVSVWVKFIDLPAGQFKAVMRKQDSYVLEITGGAMFQMNTWAGGNWATGQAWGGPVLQMEVWYFMVGVKLPDAGLEAYLDGELIGEGNKEGNADVTGNPIYVGSGSPGWQALNAVIDEFKIFNKALTSDQIVQLMDESGGRVIGVEPHRKAASVWGGIKSKHAW